MLSLRRSSSTTRDEEFLVPLSEASISPEPTPMDDCPFPAYELSYSRDAPQPPRRYPYHTAKARIGKRGLLALSLGSLPHLCAITFLLFLWLRAEQAVEGKNPGSLWQSLAFSSWLTRSITISATAVRAGMAAQAALVASMTAALLAETVPTPLLDIPLLSFTRVVSISPTSLISTSLFRSRAPSAICYSTLIVLASALVLLSQFTSTILLSDMQTVRIKRPIATTNTSYGGWTGIPGFNRDNFEKDPVSYWRFAEHSGAAPPDSTDAYIDTGDFIALQFCCQTRILGQSLRTTLEPPWYGMRGPSACVRTFTTWTFSTPPLYRSSCKLPLATLSHRSLGFFLSLLATSLDHLTAQSFMQQGFRSALSGKCSCFSTQIFQNALKKNPKKARRMSTEPSKNGRAPSSFGVSRR